MSREIKFRAWVKEEKKMLYTGFCVIPTSPNWAATEYFVPKMMEAQEWFDCSVFDWADGKMMSGGYELLQYTGLKDKNGKEIYEGDIIHNPDAPMLATDGVVKFDHRGACIRLGQNLDQLIEMIERRGSRGFEVIGNIYENPALLESKVCKE